MPVHTISPGDLKDGLPPGPGEARRWCAALEAGQVLYFPRTPVPIPAADLEFLRGQRQTSSRAHKNIAYKPGPDLLTGIDRKGTGGADFDRLHSVMRDYSQAVERFLSGFLAPYQRRWRLDYASFRGIEEEGRSSSMRRRNDLLHTDAFPTRPTRGWRILRFFHNIHPTRTRVWVVGEPFAQVVGTFAPGRLALPRSESLPVRAARQLASAAGLARLVPAWRRTPYDEFMMRLHNTMKEDAEFQASSAREQIEFAPGSSWAVFTETVPHAVLSGQYALEQTFLVDPAAMVTPRSAPIAILEDLTRARLA